MFRGIIQDSSFFSVVASLFLNAKERSNPSCMEYGENIVNTEVNFNSNDMSISFNGRYLIDIASQIENETIFDWRR